MAKKWTNKNLPGALHFITANCDKRFEVFRTERNCLLFFETIRQLKDQRPFKLIAYVAMRDHCHLIVNPRDGAITDLTGAIKGLTARRIIDSSPPGSFLIERPSPDGANHQVWQDSFKAFPLWSDWMIWQKINYIHNNPLNARLAKSAAEYRWSSFNAFYFGSSEPLPVDKDWWWPDDVKKLEIAAAEWRREISDKTSAKKG
ncbi:MAG TPA: transposase [Blastocatellia bacterium]|nr:transposase [Blastocatellia bacterium]